MAGGVKFLGGLEHRLRAERPPSVVSDEKGLKLTDDLLGGGFRDHVAFDLEFETLLEERDSLFTRDTQDGGIVGRAPVGVREPATHENYLFPASWGISFTGLAESA